jgi:hypothetical protein
MTECRASASLFFVFFAFDGHQLPTRCSQKMFSKTYNQQNHAIIKLKNSPRVAPKMKWPMNFLVLLFKTTLFVSTSYPITLTLATDTTTTVFISTRNVANNAKTKTQQQRHVSTAADAAMAMNSIAFMKILCEKKNTKDVRTYYTPSIISSNDNLTKKSDSLSAKKRNAKRQVVDTLMWPLMQVLFRQKEPEDYSPECSSTEDSSSGMQKTETNNSTPTNYNPSSTSHHHQRHETVAEYTGTLWFLPKNKGTIKFRETIRIISLDDDGGTNSSVECHTQYNDGNSWIDCSKLICYFSSSSSSSSSITERNVKMTLDCKLLVWLPLPSVASNAIRKKIMSVFESVAIGFFDEMATA